MAELVKQDFIERLAGALGFPVGYEWEFKMSREGDSFTDVTPSRKLIAMRVLTHEEVDMVMKLCAEYDEYNKGGNNGNVHEVSGEGVR